ncbi:MAG: zf-HC2 domain-containing protein, partial [Gemmatimonadaceae bacterium]
MLAVLGRTHRPNERRLSEYLDSVLLASEAAAMAAHVATCATCAGRLAELRALHTVLATLPQADAPRSFRLRAADVAPVRPAPTPLSLRLMPALTGAAFVAFAVL